MAGKEKPNQIVHRLINEERRRRGLPSIRWSQEMYLLAKDQANRMAKVGRLFHSDRYALQGGEDCWMGKGYSQRALPKAIVDSWMKSHAGHREWLLDPRVKTAGAAISSSKHGTFAAWAFSDKPLQRPTANRPKPKLGNMLSYYRRSKLKQFTKVAIVLLVIGLGVSTVAAFAGIEPLATYKDSIANKLTTMNLPAHQLHGTYITYGPLDIQASMTFKGDTVVFDNNLVGRSVYKYSIPGGLDSGDTIILTNIATGEVSTASFRYIKESDCIIAEGLTYCKE